MKSKPPKYPVYDRARDGSPFDWILRAAGELRTKQEHDLRNRPRYDPLTGRPIPPPVKP